MAALPMAVLKQFIVWHVTLRFKLKRKSRIYDIEIKGHGQANIYIGDYYKIIVQANIARDAQITVDMDSLISYCIKCQNTLINTLQTHTNQES